MVSFHGVAPGGVYIAPFVAVGPVSSYLTFPSLPCQGLEAGNKMQISLLPTSNLWHGGLFLLHFP